MPQVSAKPGSNGFLLVFEGGEGAGKSSQVSLLTQWLEERNIPWRAFREPGGTSLGEEIRALLLGSSHAVSPTAEALLFMASRAQLVEHKIKPALAAGEFVILDRFFLSTYAYQIFGRGLDAERVMGANRLAVGDLVPDLTIFLDLPPYMGLSRVKSRSSAIAGQVPDRIERSDSHFHERVHTAFLAFSGNDWMERHPECGPVSRVCAEGDKQEVFERILKEISIHSPTIFKTEKI